MGPHSSKILAILGMLILLFIAERIWRTPPIEKSIRVKCETTKGPLEIVVKPDWSPRGAERFLKLVDEGFFTQLPLFRCMEGFVCQFGAKPGAQSYPPIQDDIRRPDLRSFKPGYISFAGFAPNSRARHIFIALAAVPSLGTQPWETPFGYVSEMSTVKKFSTIYGETVPRGRGPDPQKIEAPDGASYLKEFPELDYFQSCSRL